MRKRKQYPLEFKREAVKLAQSSDQTLVVIAKELGMNVKTLRNWVTDLVLVYRTHRTSYNILWYLKNQRHQIDHHQ